MSNCNYNLSCELLKFDYSWQMEPYFTICPSEIIECSAWFRNGSERKVGKFIEKIIDSSNYIYADDE